MKLTDNAAVKGITTLTSGERYDAYAKRADGVMVALALVFLVIWTVTSVAEDTIPRRFGLVLLSVNGLIWLIFAVDLVIRFVISKGWWNYIRTHPLDVLAVVMPALRPLKVLTVFTTGSRMITSRGAFATSQAVAVSAVLLIWIGAVAIFNAEHGAPGAQIETFRDALWWALVTVTTVGYGDFYPVTGQGRIVAGALMVVGIALLGVVTATVAAWFVRLTSAEKDEKDEASIAKNEREIKRLHKKIDVLEAKIATLVERSDPGGK